jgi:hypothetical protein
VAGFDGLADHGRGALAAGDPLGALKRVALRDDAPALALAWHRARAARRSGAGEGARAARGPCLRREGGGGLARAASSPKRRSRLASRDLGWPAKALDAARETLEAHGDRVNAAHARISASGACC